MYSQYIEGDEVMRGLTVVDLFAGAGGLSEGFRQAGYEIKLAIEIDEWAAQTFAANHSNTRVITADIRDFETDASIRALMADRPAVIVGGPPCQGFSISGPSKKDPRDPRNSLFRDFVRFVRALEPEAFVMENVKGLLSARTASGEKVIDIIHKSFRELGYHVESRILNAADFGVPQIRHRVFVIGIRDRVADLWPSQTHWPFAYGQNEDLQHRLLLEEAYSIEGGRHLTLWEAVSDLPQIESGEEVEFQDYVTPPQNEYQRFMRERSAGIWNHVPMKHSKRLIERFKIIGYGQSVSDVKGPLAQRRRNGNGTLAARPYDQNNRRLRPDRPSHTIAAAFYANFVHPFLHRNITAREAARLQSFPDKYIFKGKKTVPSHSLLRKEGRVHDIHIPQYSQIGNAVPPLLARAVARQLLQNLVDTTDTSVHAKEGPELRGSHS